MTRAIGFRGVQQGPAERSRDFRGTAIRMVKRLAPQRFLTATVITLSMTGIAIGVIDHGSSDTPPTCCSTA